MDEVHILNTTGFENIEGEQSLYFTQTPTEELKIFYLYTKETVPQKIKNIVNILKPTYSMGDTKYTTTYIGYDEAQMMIEEDLFTKKFDTIEGLFGNNIIIAEIARKTYTALDMMHFVPKEEWKK